MQIQISTPILYEGKRREEGEFLEVPDPIAQRLINKGKARNVQSQASPLRGFPPLEELAQSEPIHSAMRPHSQSETEETTIKAKSRKKAVIEEPIAEELTINPDDSGA